jgi:hypothetical protein
LPIGGTAGCLSSDDGPLDRLAVRDGGVSCHTVIIL